MKQMIYEQYLNEWKNISDSVLTVGKKLSMEIFMDSKPKKPILSKVNKLSYLTGNFTFIIDECFPKINGKYINTFGIDKLNVTYVLYLVDDIQQYNTLSSEGGDVANASSSDFQNKSITIVSGIIGGYMIPDYMETIMHELNHLYEYAHGREKRVNLYDTAVNLIKNGKTEDEKNIGRLIYMTFPHEIDAFVHQFYGFLLQNRPDGSFNDLIGYTMYKNMSYLMGLVDVKSFDSELGKTVNELGLTWKSFKNRTTFALKKLKRKLFNAYKRYRMEYGNKNMAVESFFKRDMSEMNLLDEYRKRYKEIKYGIEPIYEI